MLDHSTVTKLREMKLGKMADAFQEQLDDTAFSELSYAERFGLVVDAEWDARQSNKLKRLTRNSGYIFPNACIEDIEYHSDRKLDKSMFTMLSTCNYIREFHNIMLLGASGSGKTYLSNALGNAANRKSFQVKYIRVPDLFDELAIARGDGTERKYMKQLRQVPLLILDEWLLYTPNQDEAKWLLEIVESRHKKASTIFCSQYLVSGWRQKFGETGLADAVCDRIAFDSHIIHIGKMDKESPTMSMRKRKGIKSET